MELTIFLVLAFAAAGGILGLKLKLPAGAMLGAMIAVAIFGRLRAAAVRFMASTMAAASD